MNEIEELKQKVTALETKLADVMGDGGSFRKLQVEIDSQLQLHKDKDAAHAAALQQQAGLHAEAIEVLLAQHVGNVEALNSTHAAELSKQAEEHAVVVTALKAANESATETLKSFHAAEIKRLKESVLAPALKAQHAKEAADLKAKQDAELAAL